MSDNPFRTPPKQPTQRRMWIRAILVIVVLIPLTCLAGVGWRAWRYVDWRQSAQSRVNTEIERLKAAGEPLTAAELHAIHRVPAGTVDLTNEWLAVLADLDAVRPDPKDPELQNLPLIGPRTLEELEPAANNSCLAATESYLVRIEPQVQSLLELSTKGGEVRFPVKFEDHLGARLDHAEHIRHAVKVLEIKCRMCLIHADASELERTLSAMAALPHTLDHSRTVIEQLVRCAAIRRCCMSLLEAANRGSLGSEQLRRFAEQLGDYDFKQAAHLAYTGERVMSWEAMNENASIIADDPGGLTTFISSAGPVDRAFLLSGFARAVAASKHDYLTARREFDLINQDIRSLSSLHPWERVHYFYSVLLLPANCAAHFGFANQDAFRRTTRAALLAHDYRIRSGKWPGNLTELSASHEAMSSFVDPFTGDELLIRSDGPDLVIYSVGANQIDDGGIEENERLHPDIVVNAKPPPMPTGRE